MRVVIWASTLLLLATGAAYADERPLTDQERTRLKEAVTAQGCSGGKLMREGEKFKVDDAKCADGKEYELTFDAEFKLTKKELD